MGRKKGAARKPIIIIIHQDVVSDGVPAGYLSINLLPFLSALSICHKK